MNSSDVSDTASILVEPVQSCAACGTHVDVSNCEPLHKFACPECSADFTVRARLGRYALVSRLGRGGSGLAFKAFDPDLKRHIAIKLLRRDLVTDAEVIAEFEKEALIMGSLRDEHVVQIYTTGRHGDRMYLAMELMEGGSLEEQMTQRGALPEGEIIEIAIQIASGLAAAHRRGVVHRDVKPGNILFNSEGIAKVADFGLSALDSQAVNISNEIKGTAFYLPPERVNRRNEDHRSDIYALGATLFHALSGRPVFDAPTAGEIAMKHVSTPAPSVLTFAPRVSPLAARVLGRMLMKAPRDRQSSYEELVAEWMAVKTRSVIGTRQGPTPAMVAASQRKGQAFVTLMFIAGTAVIAAIFLFYVVRSKRTAEGGAHETTAASIPAAESATASKTAVQDPPKKDMLASPAPPAPAKLREVVLFNEGNFPAGSTALAISWESIRWFKKSELPFATGNRTLCIRGSGVKEFYYSNGATPITIPAGARISANVYLDPAAPPRAFMIRLATNKGWRNQILWGDSKAISQYGQPKTKGRLVAGPLPEPGRWAKLDALITDTGLDAGESITGMSLVEESGAVYFGKISLLSPP